MKSTAVLLAICSIAVFAAERFDCGKFQVNYDINVESLDANSTNCCLSEEKTCKTSIEKQEFYCNQAKGQTADASEDSTKQPSVAKCCKTTHCGQLESGFKCPIGYMPDTSKMSDSGSGEVGNDKTACCVKFVKTCINTEDVGGNGADAKPFSCPAGKVLDSNNWAKTDVKESICCTTDPDEDFTPTCSYPTEGDISFFDCYAVGMEWKDGNVYNLSPRNKTTCCQDFQSTCGRPEASSLIPYQCPDDQVRKSGNPDITEGDDTTAEKDERCCTDPTCLHGFDRTCADYPIAGCKSDEELTNLAVKAYDNDVCCKKKDSTSSSTRREVAYSIFILGAISASLA